MARKNMKLKGKLQTTEYIPRSKLIDELFIAFDIKNKDKDELIIKLAEYAKIPQATYVNEYNEMVRHLKGIEDTIVWYAYQYTLLDENIEIQEENFLENVAKVCNDNKIIWRNKNRTYSSLKKYFERLKNNDYINKIKEGFKELESQNKKKLKKTKEGYRNSIKSLKLDYLKIHMRLITLTMEYIKKRNAFDYIVGKAYDRGFKF